MSASAGRVLLIPKGAYNASTTYTVMDSVTYQGNSYVCKQTSTGNVPTNTTYWQILVDNSDLVGDISDLTTEVGNVKQALSDEVNVRSVLGAHQFLDYDLTKLKALNAGGTWASNKYSLNSVEITVNDDNSLIFSTDANGATGVVDFTINNRIYLEDGTYTLDVDVTTFDSYTYTRVMGWNGSSWVELANRPKNFTASGTYQYYQLVIRLLAGATFNPSKTYKPLIKLASDSSNAFTSYAMTNKELTDVVAEKSVTMAVAEGSNAISSIVWTDAKKVGKVVIGTVRLGATLSAGENSNIAVFSEHPIVQTCGLVINLSSMDVLGYYTISSAGKLTIQAQSAVTNNTLELTFAFITA